MNERMEFPVAGQYLVQAGHSDMKTTPSVGLQTLAFGDEPTVRKPEAMMEC